MKILTPAKITPLLYILRKRKDGYHDLYMHMVPIGLYDELEFYQNSSCNFNLKVTGSNHFLKKEENLVFRATKLFEENTGKKIFLDIILKKRIPIGAGLGGGSGNAAGLLRALNYIFRESPNNKGLLPPSKLFEMALELGSDVPFFLNPQPCEVSGIGENLVPIKNYPKVFVIIIKPYFSISTADAYRECNTQEKIIFPTIESLDDLKTKMNNDFEKTLFNQYPILKEMKSVLFENGAFGALVSGSGSAIFGIFKKKNDQNQAYKNIACLKIGEIFSCETLQNHCYF